MDLWPHQTRAVEGVQAAIAAGERQICLTAPTGAGKSLIACTLIEQWIDEGHTVVLYSNRRMLTDQLSRVLSKHSIDHGVRAAGWNDEDGKVFPVQVSSIQTEEARVYKSKKWTLHPATRVLIDEAHIQKGEVARKVLADHLEAGAACVGVTATPLDIGDLYTHLVQAGMTSEMRECGALVPAQHYGPDEPDLMKFRGLVPGQDFTEKQNVSAMMRDGIFGRVLTWFKKLNPSQKPTILFGPGVRESLWFAEQFCEAGIPAAHIDGEMVWVNGEAEKTGRMLRDRVLAQSERGEIKVICNRFVMREGIDAPWLEHMIFATVFGSLQSYLQSGGRGLRAYPGKDRLIVQDHGGNWHRHGSLNADREWDLAYTSEMLAGVREQRFRDGKAREPGRCPKCARIITGPKCQCGYESPTGARLSRPVVQVDGTLKEMQGDIYKPRRISTAKDGPAQWERMYYRSKTKKGERTFRAAMALFAYENNWAWPDPSWPFMPKNEMDVFRLVNEVPTERLNGKGS